MSPKPALEPRKRPKQQRSRDTLEQIVEAAAQVFASHGYAAGTTNRIAERAGVSVGSVYQYFPNKDAILVALYERHMQRARSEIDSLLTELDREPDDVQALLRRFLLAIVRLHTHSPGLHRVLFDEAPRPRRVRRMMQEFEAGTVERLASWFERSSSVSVAAPVCAAYIVSQTVEALAHQFALYAPPGMGEETLVAEVVSLLVGYLER